jgi:hypothetical protein
LKQKQIPSTTVQQRYEAEKIYLIVHLILMTMAAALRLTIILYICETVQGQKKAERPKYTQASTLPFLLENLLISLSTGI